MKFIVPVAGYLMLDIRKGHSAQGAWRTVMEFCHLNGGAKRHQLRLRRINLQFRIIRVRLES
jgi:hypothetical protein